MELVVEVYKLTKTFPAEEKYGLVSQMNRAAVSVPSNIAEGMGRMSVKEQIHFIEIAFGSLNETMCQLELAYELNYISQEDLLASEDFTKEITRMLSRLRRIRLDKLTVALPH